MKNNKEIEIELYYDNHCYETEVIRFYILPESICLSEYTYEHAPGGSYGLNYVLDSENRKKFLSCIGAEGIDLEETVKRKFSGPAGARKFNAFCTEHNIEYRIHL